MSLPHTYRLVAATVAVMLFFGGTAPLIQHVCAQLGLMHSHTLDECCHDEPEAPPENEADALLPCHDDEPEEPQHESSTVACCPSDGHDAETPPAILPKQDVDHPALTAPVTASFDVPVPTDTAADIIDARAPPASLDAPLFILHEALLN